MAGQLVNIADFDSVFTGTDGPHRPAGRPAKVFQFPAAAQPAAPTAAGWRRAFSAGGNLWLEIAAALFIVLVWALLHFCR